MTGRRWRALVAVGALGVMACGGEPQPERAMGLDLGVTVSAAIADQATDFQIVLIANGSKYDCASLQSTCLSDSGVPDSDLVRLTNASGQQQKILVVQNTLAQGGSSQALTLDNLSPGKDFALLVQAVASHQLLGGGCKYLPEIRSGANDPALIRVNAVDPSTTCDPTLAP